MLDSNVKFESERERERERERRDIPSPGDAGYCIPEIKLPREQT